MLTTYFLMRFSGRDTFCLSSTRPITPKFLASLNLSVTQNSSWRRQKNPTARPRRSGEQGKGTDPSTPQNRRVLQPMRWLSGKGWLLSCSPFLKSLWEADPPFSCLTVFPVSSLLAHPHLHKTGNSYFVVLQEAFREVHIYSFLMKLTKL